MLIVGASVSCVDGVRNGNEEGLDCGGPNCDACPGSGASTSRFLVVGLIILGVFILLILICLLAARRFCERHSRVPVPYKRAKVQPLVKIVQSVNPVIDWSADEEVRRPSRVKTFL